MGDLPEVEVPAHVRERFLASIPNIAEGFLRKELNASLDRLRALGELHIG